MMSIYLRKLVLGIIGIYILFICLSYYTEKIYNHPYPFYKGNKNGHVKSTYFKYPSLITWTGCLLCTIYAWFVAKINGEKQNPIDMPSRKKIGLLFCLNILPSNFALLYVSYPLQVIAKASRYFFLILFGAFFSKNQRIQGLIIPKHKILIAIAIMAASIVFIYEETANKLPIDHFKSPQKWIGVSLLVIAVISDALFVDQQAYCRNTFHPSPNQLFLTYNFYAFLIIFASALVGGTLFSSLKFCYNHPSIILDIGAVCILQLINQQIAIYLIIVNFKQYIYPLISSTRRIIVLIASIVIFQHNLTYLQWTAVLLISIGILVQLYQEIKTKQSKEIKQNNQRSLVKDQPQEQLDQSKSQ